MSVTYEEFIQSKVLKALPSGFEATFIPDQAFDYQRDIIKWAVKRGKAAIFADTGTGKTLMFLTWAYNIHLYTQGNILILAPLAVSYQHIEEAAKFGIPINLVKSQEDCKPGLNITNYERLHLFDPSYFVGLVLDESSCIKAFESTTRKQINDFSFNLPYRLACTATPAPNDTIEITNHSEFLGIMSGKEIIALYFTQDGNTTQHWRLKGHAKEDFYKWLATWAVALRKPSDLGYSDDNFILPKLTIELVVVDSPECTDTLFPMDAIGLKEQRTARRDSMQTRLEATQKLVAEYPNDPWLIWCDLNTESETLRRGIPNAIEVKGSDSNEHKEKHLIGFSKGTTQILVSKSTICGFGMNWQHCNKMIFFGLSYSFEQFYQAIRRCWRFGQKNEVKVYIVLSDREIPVYHTVQRKQKEAELLLNQLVKHMVMHSEIKQAKKEEMEYKPMVQMELPEYLISNPSTSNSNKTENPNVLKQAFGQHWALYNGDSTQVLDGLKDNSIALSIQSPAFPLMYAYTNSKFDLGNTRNITDFIEHFRYMISKNKLLRVTMPGRLCCLHLMQLNAMKSREGYIGIQDYRGRVIQMMIDEGWIYHGEVTIDKNPQVQATRNHERGLLFKSLATDSSVMRMALADYVLCFRKPGDNPKPIHAGISKKYNPGKGWITEQEWIEWASPVWYRHQKGMPGGIRETDVLNVVQARETNDERHLCPLQLGVVERCLKLWSAPDETVLSIFNGIGSEGYMAVKLNRNYIGIELKESYYNNAIKNLESAERLRDKRNLFDLMDEENQEENNERLGNSEFDDELINDQGESFGEQEEIEQIESEYPEELDPGLTEMDHIAISKADEQLEQLENSKITEVKNFTGDNQEIITQYTKQSPELTPTEPKKERKPRTKKETTSVSNTSNSLFDDLATDELPY